MTIQGAVQLTAPAPSYSTEFVELDPEDSQFAADLDNPQVQGNELEVDPDAETEVRAVLDQITDDGDTALQVARKVQAYLRGPTFTYSPELAAQAADGNLSDEPLARFLRDQARLLRAVRLGHGHALAGRRHPGPDGGRVPARSHRRRRPRRARLRQPRLARAVLPAAGLGALRAHPRQPAAASRRSTAIVPLGGGSSSSASPTTSLSTSSATPSTGPSRDVTDDLTGTTTGTTGTGALSFVTRHATTILVVLLALLIAAIVPFGAWLSRRRARAAALDDADRVEAEWQSLLLRLQDIGFVPPDGATPRQASRTIGHDAYLTPDENDALGRVVTTLERARYARPGADLVDVTDDARTVWRGALSRRRRTDRARALLLPEEGKQMWRGLGRSLLFLAATRLGLPSED